MVAIRFAHFLLSSPSCPAFHVVRCRLCPSRVYLFVPCSSQLQWHRVALKDTIGSCEGSLAERFVCCSPWLIEAISTAEPPALLLFHHVFTPPLMFENLLCSVAFGTSCFRVTQTRPEQMLWAGGSRTIMDRVAVARASLEYSPPTRLLEALPCLIAFVSAVARAEDEHHAYCDMSPSTFSHHQMPAMF